MRRVRRIGLVLLVLVALLHACASLIPVPRPYRPENSREELLWAKARRDLFPEDVRRRPDAYRQELVAWPGIISLAHREAGDRGAIWKLTLAHHYWDWIERPDRSTPHIWLSPRGEGFFQCSQPVLDSTKPHDPRGELAIVYGYPEKVLESEIIQLQCVTLRQFHRSVYSTEVLEYGRRYVSNQDVADLKRLRDP